MATKIDEKIKELLRRGITIAGSQNELAHYLGYTGKNAGCQINYFLCGKRKHLPAERYFKLIQLINK